MGSIVISSRAPIGHIAIAGVDLCTNQGCKGLVPARPDIVTEYFYYQLSAAVTVLQQAGRGSTFQELSTTDLGLILLAHPCEKEQQAIAAFLDRETTRIDALIARKEELIRLIEEKRIGLINCVVTRGLEPNAPLNESGIPWLGTIPAHWEVRKLKHISRELAGRRIVQPHLYFVPDGVPLLSAINIEPNGIIRDDIKMVNTAIDERHAASRVRAGDLLTVRVGDPGVTAVIPPDLDGCHFASTMLIRGDSSFSSSWLSHCMNSAVVQAQIDAANYGAAQKQFNIGVAANFLLPVPPLEEQERIADHLDGVWSQMDTLIATIETHQELFREHRQALITAAVTGQIDVRAELPA